MKKHVFIVSVVILSTFAYTMEQDQDVHITLKTHEHKLLTKYLSSAIISHIAPLIPWKRLYTLKCKKTDIIPRAEFTRDGTQVVTIHDSTAKIWDVKTGTLLQALKDTENNKGIFSATFNSNGLQLAIIFLNGPTKIWNTQTSTLLHTLDDKTITRIAFSPNNAYIATTSDKTAKIWHAESGKLLPVLKHDYKVTGLLFNHNSSEILTIYSCFINIWDIAKGESLHTLGHKDNIHSATYSHNNVYVAATDWHNDIKIWLAKTGQLHRTMTHKGIVNSVAFNHDDSQIITTSHKDDARIWDVITGQLLRVLPHHYASTAQFNRDNSQAFTYSESNTGKIKIWDNTTGKLLYKINPPNKAFNVNTSHGIITIDHTGTISGFDPQSQNMMTTIHTLTVPQKMNLLYQLQKKPTSLSEVQQKIVQLTNTQ